jgi:hypothetical protein
MSEFYRNSEGYVDLTAAEAINSMAKPGEIWMYKGRECLIVKNQSGHSNILQLSTSWKKGSIEIGSYYAQPGMLSYAFNDLLGERVSKLTDTEFNTVVEEIEEALQMRLIKKECVQQKTPDDSWMHEQAEKQRIIIREKEDENQRLRGQVELMKNLYNDLLGKVIDKVGA